MMGLKEKGTMRVSSSAHNMFCYLVSNLTLSLSFAVSRHSQEMKLLQQQLQDLTPEEDREKDDEDEDQHSEFSQLLLPE
jgi:hypothetical protein